MDLYLDSSIVVALFVADALSARSERLLEKAPAILVISDFVMAEFASAVARRVRMKLVTPGEARSVFADFDSWAARVAARIETMPQDIDEAARILRRLDLNLRAPDAVNIAIAQRVGAQLATFDEGMAAAAKSLRVPVAAT